MGSAVNQRLAKISVVIIALNEQRNIARCLRSVQAVADEIVVLDSGSEDRTRLICERYGVRFYEQRFSRFDDQKNEAIRKASFRYILSLDADEVLSKELVASIQAVKGNWEYDCFRLSRINNFCGRWIRHGEWYPDESIRLFDRTKANWEGAVHEKVVPLSGCSTSVLTGELLHYSYYSVSQFRQKSEFYADLMAKELFRRGKRPFFFHLYLKPLYRFFYAFIIRGGFLDGYSGYCIARLTSERLALKFLKLKILCRQH